MDRPKLSLRLGPRVATPALSDGVVDVDGLLARVREIVREELQAYATSADTEPSEFVEKHTSGVGPSIFLTAARAGEFDTFRVGKRFVARAADVRANIERQRVPRERARASHRKLDEFDVQLASRAKRTTPREGTTNLSAPARKGGPHRATS